MIFIFILSIIATLIINFYKAENVICKPPNDFVQVFAPPGTGKTTLAAKIVREALVQNKKVYSNVNIISADSFNITDLGKKEIKDCILIIDEAGIEVGNRDWRNNLSKAQIRFLKKHRHYNVDIYLFSQSFNDVDNKFRDLTTKLFLLEKSRIPFFVNMKAIRKRIDIIGGAIVDYYYWSNRESKKFFTPNCWAYFNSYEKDEELPTMEVQKYLKVGNIYEKQKGA